MKSFWVKISLLVAAALVGVVALGLTLLAAFSHDLPDYKDLANYDPPIVSRLYARDGSYLSEFASENRFFVPISAIPPLVKNAFIAAEDQNFYQHAGVDFFGIVRALLTNVVNVASDRRLVGASTITQQVAKNFLLTNEISFTRKFKEAILAFRIDKAYSKERILELYLNEIYLGRGTYGVAAAALNYFDKSLTELTVAEAAFLAALPKAPNNYDPERQAAAAKARRDWVIGRLFEDKYITLGEAESARAEPLVARARGSLRGIKATYFVEEIRRELVAKYSDTMVYKGGLSVRTTLDPRLQAIADETLRAGLENYDRRRGWRGAVTTLELSEGWQGRLQTLAVPPVPRPWRLAVVTAVADGQINLAFRGGGLGTLTREGYEWTGRSASKLVSVGDVIWLEDKAGRLELKQAPQVNGALVAIEPASGRVLALTGGYSFDKSEFNRATQALRQTGSAIKPFVYLAALQHGLTPSTLVLDAPLSLEQGPGLPMWNPENYSEDYLGATPLRTGLELSRNLMTIRIAQAIGIENVARLIEDFGIADRVPPYLSISLGAVESTLLRMTAAYAMVANGGYRVTPSLVERVQDRRGVTLARFDTRTCSACHDVVWQNQTPPLLPDERPIVAEALSAYQVTALMQGVVQRGTAALIGAALNRPLAGKTGTSNDNKDAWFIGYAPDLVVGVFVGFDTPRSLGAKETGATVAAPIFRDFMLQALKNQSIIPFRIPSGLRLVRVSRVTGQLPSAGERDVILEAFKPGTEPTDDGGGAVLDPSITAVLGGAVTPADAASGITAPNIIFPADNPTPAVAPPANDDSGLGGLY